MTVESGSPSDLAGLLVVNPIPGNEGNNHDTGAEAHEQPKGGDGDPSEVDWNNAEATDTGEGDAPKGDDEPTGDDDAPADGGEETAEDDGEQPAGADEPTYEVTNDGKVEKVSLKEALAGYSRQTDYTRKTEEVARQREALAQELQGVQAHRASYKQVLDA